MKLKKSGFTLIELLVVIAIIAILAAILFPVFAQAKAAAKKAVDLSNVKELTLATIMYGSDYDDYFPRGDYDIIGRGVGEPVTWHEIIYPYVKNGGNGGTTVAAFTASSGLYSSPSAPSNSINDYDNNAEVMPSQAWWCTDIQYSGFKKYCDVTTTPASNNYGGGPLTAVVPGSPGVAAPSVSSSALPFPASTMALAGGGVPGAGGTGGPFFTPWIFWWDGAYLGTVNGVATPTAGAFQPNPGWDADAGFPASWLPRYRYTGVDNVGWADGHAKGKPARTISWCLNVFVPGSPSNGFNTGTGAAGDYTDAPTFSAGGVCANFQQS